MRSHKNMPPAGAFQRPRTPVLSSRFVHVPQASRILLHTGEQTIVCPTQFGTHCVPIWESAEKGPHVAQIALIKARAELTRQLSGQGRQQRLAIAGAHLPALLEFDDVATEFPAGFHLNHID
jgi:ABC-type nitrate/sulfonate/bicarbonate transport system ATPase subunit